jgi:nanoRNase/pAp phosphatase (c-di-AMP/oligoRNAs hydrolase)
MVAFPRPQVIFTHESDLDGFVSGLLLQRLARHLFNVEVPLQAYHNHNWRQRALPETFAWVSDMTFDARLDRAGWVIVDHHSTEVSPKSATLIHDLNKSASLLCYELCQQNGLGSPELDQLVHYTNLSDLFLVDDPDFVLAHDYATLIKSYQFWNVHELIQGRLESLLNHPLLEVMEVKRRIENPLGYAWSRANVTEVTPNLGYVETVVGNINLIVHQLLDKRDTPFPALLTLFRRGNASYIVSLRSRNGEALKIAEKLKGGGHANAAGATLPRSVQSVQDALQYLRQVLNPGSVPHTSFNSIESLFEAIEATD